MTLHLFFLLQFAILCNGRKGFGSPNIATKFKYTGKLQPGIIGPRLEVPSHIQLPDYAKDGKPKNSDKLFKNPWDVAPLAPEDIPRMRVAGRIAREVIKLQMYFPCYK